MFYKGKSPNSMGHGFQQVSRGMWCATSINCHGNCQCHVEYDGRYANVLPSVLLVRSSPRPIVRWFKKLFTHWIGWRENLQETDDLLMILTLKMAMVSCRFSFQPMIYLWKVGWSHSCGFRSCASNSVSEGFMGYVNSKFSWYFVYIYILASGKLT